MATKLKLVRRIGGGLELLDLGAIQGWSVEELCVFPDDESSGTWFYRTSDACWIVEVADYCYETTALELIRKFIDQMIEIPDELRDDVATALPQKSASQPPPDSPPILLGGPDDVVNVINLCIPPLPKPRYDVLRPLVDAYPIGLTEDDLKTNSTHEGCVTIFKRMKKKYPALDRVLESPGRRGCGGYRLVWPGGWRN